MASGLAKQYFVIGVGTAIVLMGGFWDSLHGQTVLLKAVNELGFSRSNVTIELSADLLTPFGLQDLTRIHVRDAAGRELLCQAIDMDSDGRADLVVFQSDFGPGEAKQFQVYEGQKWVYQRDQFKAYGRFVRERCDDFAWENDRVAHRMYGKALETWIREPLTSSAVDIWSKRTSKLIINDWYMLDNYHEDFGEGADFYSAGSSRGCGGNGLWSENRLWVSRNFVRSRVIANGPIRVCFELEYEPFDVAGISVAEVKRITLDAGHQLSKFESFYKPYVRPGQTVQLVMGVGLKKVKGEQLELNPQEGWFLKWEPMEKNAGYQGLALVFQPSVYLEKTEDKLNHLVLVRLDGVHGTYWAGYCWDKAGIITNPAAWKQYVSEFAHGLSSPVKVTVVRNQ